MIIDRIALAGISAYFTKPDSSGGLITNLAAPDTGTGAVTYPVVARTVPIAEGSLLRASRITLLIEGENLSALFAHQPSPLLEIVVSKELFSGLYGDPYATRVHNIAGFEDLNGGTATNCRAIEVDGVATLVSHSPGACQWLSVPYELPVAVTVADVAWDLFTPRSAPRRGFSYSLELRTWTAGQSTANPPTDVVRLAVNRSPDTVRAAHVGPLTGDVAAYQLAFSAMVRDEGYLYERHTSALDPSIGSPLLQGVHLLETVASPLHFSSLREIIDRSASYEFFMASGDGRHRLLVDIPIQAILSHSRNDFIAGRGALDPKSLFEFVEVRLPAPGLKFVEAWLGCEQLLRLPRK